jgi:hypothetical protein
MISSAVETSVADSRSANRNISNKPASASSSSTVTLRWHFTLLHHFVQTETLDTGLSETFCIPLGLAVYGLMLLFLFFLQLLHMDTRCVASCHDLTRAKHQISQYHGTRRAVCRLHGSGQERNQVCGGIGCLPACLLCLLHPPSPHLPLSCWLWCMHTLSRVIMVSRPCPQLLVFTSHSWSHTYSHLILASPSIFTLFSDCILSTHLSQYLIMFVLQSTTNILVCNCSHQSPQLLFTVLNFYSISMVTVTPEERTSSGGGVLPWLPELMRWAGPWKLEASTGERPTNPATMPSCLLCSIKLCPCLPEQKWVLCSPLGTHSHMWSIRHRKFLHFLSTSGYWGVPCLLSGVNLF